MKKLLLMVFMVFSLGFRASALEIEVPEVPDSASRYMPEEYETFGDGLMKVLRDSMAVLRPDLAEASRVCTGILAAVMLLSMFAQLPEKNEKVTDLTGAVCVGGLLISATGSLIGLGADTVTQLSDYGKLLLPVMTAAMAAQGGVAASAALYTGTAAVNALLTALISGILTPLIYVYIALSVANSAIGESVLKKSCELVKLLVSRCLRTILYVFTGYMGVTGVVTGTADAAALKVTKMTISGMVPVVGGILSDASEAVLVSAGLVRNAAGVYGILAILAVCLVPFLRIGIHYLMLKATGAVCGLFGSKRITELIGDFSSAMGLLLAMTGSECLLLLISTVCFLRGVA